MSRPLDRLVQARLVRALAHFPFGRVELIDSWQTTRTRRSVVFGACLLLFLSMAACDRKPAGDSISILHVSYDPTRELYADINPLFSAHYEKETGKQVEIRMSHGGAGKQARSVIDGLEADVVTLALAYDIDAMHDKRKLLPADWQKRLPDNAAPYTSTIVFLVRGGNPKNIRDWDDLVRDDVQVITPNPKTSGGARWNYLAAWGYALKKGKSPEEAKAFVTDIFKRVPVLDSGARGSTTTFVERGIGDVLLAWENEALLATKELSPGKVEILIPTVSILAEPPVAVLDTHVDKHGTRHVAEAYLAFLYRPEVQDLIGKNFYRPRDPAAQRKYASQFPALTLFTVDELFGGWQKAQAEHFADGGAFDAIHAP